MCIRDRLKTMTSLLLEEGLVFPYTRELSKHIPVPEDIMDKAMVEYRGKKDAHPELQVRKMCIRDRPWPPATHMTAIIFWWQEQILRI